MTEELRIRDSQLEKCIVSIKELFTGLEKSKRIPQDLDLIRDQLKTSKHALQLMEIEIPKQAHSDKRTYRQKCKHYKTEIRELENDYEFKKQAGNRGELLDGGNTIIRDLDTEKGLIELGLTTDEESKTSLGRSVAVIDITLDLARKTAAKVDEDTHKIVGILDGLDSIEDSMERSKVILKRIGRRIMTDKYIWVFIFLIIAAIIFIVTWKKTHS